MTDEKPRYIDHELIAAIEKFIAEHPGMTASAFGTQSINDPALVTDLREGRELRRVTRERVLAFIGEPKKGEVPTQPTPALQGSKTSSARCLSASKTLISPSEAAE